MIADEDILRAFSRLWRELGGDPGAMPIDGPDELYDAFANLSPPQDVLAMVRAWHGQLTNRELLPLIELRVRTLHRSLH